MWINAYECFSMFVLYIFSGKPLVSFVLVGNPISFEINMLKPKWDIYFTGNSQNV